MAVGLLGNWTRSDWVQASGMLAVVAVLHMVGFGALAITAAPANSQVGAHVFSIGLGLTAYMFGIRHAFDADHIAAIDNVTRKLASDGRRPKSVGFWFALGHSGMVMLLALLVVAAARTTGALLDESSATRHLLGVAGTLLSGSFLYVIAIINVVALAGIWRAYTAMRNGSLDMAQLDRHLDSRGLVARLLRPVMSRITRPGQMFAVGMLFGLGFDTATEVTLLAMAGTGAAAGVPWYAVLTLPVLFAAGMSLMDSIDGLFMAAAYDWAFTKPVRKIVYNLTITALSVAVAWGVGTVELVSVLHDDLGWANPLTGWLSSVNLDYAGFAIVALFALLWTAAIAVWRLRARPS